MIPFKDNIPSKTFPFVNISLILINLAVFGYELSLASAGTLDVFFTQWSLVPLHFIAHPLKNADNLLLSMFFHGGWIHLIANMFYLAIFGDNVEDRMGHFRYIIFYLLCGITSFIFQILNTPLSQIPLIGASGAIAGILGAYFILYPWAKIHTLIFIFSFEIPAFLFLGGWFFIQMLNSFFSITSAPIKGCTGGIAWWAHIGGFISGIILIFFFKKKKYYRALY
ncbi:rhomboid family intramembrane serine protease [bacterium]|nr:rhomboid family intramembrane serine protease [bacterium]